MTAPVAVIGLGNRVRGDDATGLEVVARLADGPGYTGHAYEGEAIGLLDLWAGAAGVVLVDAVRSGAPPGTVHRFDATSQPIPVAVRRTSSHAIGASEAIELARTLKTLPRAVVFYGIEGERFAAGAPLSEAVASVISRVAEAVTEEARSLAATRRSASA